jgi:hypothetical protein
VLDDNVVRFKTVKVASTDGRAVSLADGIARERRS